MADLNEIAETLSGLTVMEAAELATLLEDKWGVSAAAPVAVAAAGGGVRGAAAGALPQRATAGGAERGCQRRLHGAARPGLRRWPAPRAGARGGRDAARARLRAAVARLGARGPGAEGADGAVDRARAVVAALRLDAVRAGLATAGGSRNRVVHYREVCGASAACSHTP